MNNTKNAALVISIEQNLPFNNGTKPYVRLFDTTADAEQYAFDQLVECGQLLQDPDGSIWWPTREEKFESVADALHAWQDSTLGSSEYFHATEVKWKPVEAGEGQAPSVHHPSVQHVINFFRYEHLPEELQKISEPFEQVAMEIACRNPDSPETTVALRKLLEAKDAAVRAAL